MPGEPAKPGIPIADIGTALYAYSSVLAALYERERTGRLLPPTLARDWTPAAGRVPALGADTDAIRAEVSRSRDRCR